MTALLQRIREVVGRSAADAALCRSMLEDAVRRRSRVELEIHGPQAVDRASLMMTTIETLGREELVVGQPMSGRIVRPLITAERLLLHLSTSCGRFGGEVTTLGRIVLPSGGSTAFHGYRLTIPTALRSTERRRRGRVQVGFDLAPGTTLVATDGSSRHASGVMHDLGVQGCRIRSREARGRFRPGDTVRVRVELPGAGTIEATGVVTHTRRGRNPADVMVGVRFDRTVDMLQGVLGDIEQHRRRRVSA